MCSSDWSADVCSSDLECRVGALLQKRAKGDLVIGHRGGPRVRVACRNPTLPKIATVATDRPADARSLAVAPAGRSVASYDRTSAGSGRSVSLRVELGRRRIIQITTSERTQLKH